MERAIEAVACGRAAGSGSAKHFFNSICRQPGVVFDTGRDTRHITRTIAPNATTLHLKKGVDLKLRRLRLVASLAARYRALIGVRPRRDETLIAKAWSPQSQSYMTTEEIEDVVRALITIVDNLETGSARQSMQEAFTQVRAHASAIRASAKAGPRGQRGAGA